MCVFAQLVITSIIVWGVVHSVCVCGWVGGWMCLRARMRVKVREDTWGEGV